VGCISFSLARVQYYNFVVSVIAEYIGPSLLDPCIQPHKFVLRASFDFAIILCIQIFELVLELLGGSLRSNKNDTQSALSTQTDISGALVMKFRDYIANNLHISVIHCLVALESRELPPPGTNTSE